MSLCPPEKIRALLSTLSLAVYVNAEFAVMRSECKASGRWYRDLDDLWSNVLSYFEKRGILSEDVFCTSALLGSISWVMPCTSQETLEYLDADPFVLFGVDDPLTQQDRSQHVCVNCQRLPSVSFDVSEGSSETRQVPGIDVRWPGPTKRPRVS